MGVIVRAASVVAVGVMMVGGGVAFAQTPPASPQTTTPNAETPPGGIARGVVPPPVNVDPGMVTPPPAASEPSMPVIKPPTGAR